MYYVGLDVHKRKSNVCILDGGGTPVKTWATAGPVDRMVGQLRTWARTAGQPLAVCFEASLGYGPLYQQLSRFCQHVQVAHPGRLRLIFQDKKKHDRVDARKLAQLLLLDLIPQVHVPHPDVGHWRMLIEFRRRLVDERTAIKNGLHAVLRSEGIVKPREVGGLWTKKGLQWLSELALPEGQALRRDMLLQDLDHKQKQIQRVTRTLDQWGQRHPAVRLLQSIPGIGPRTAEAFVAWIDQPQRFRSARQVGTYLGLVPREDSSGGTQRLGRITRDGPGTLRKLLVEAAWRGIKTCPHLHAEFQKRMQGNPDRRKIAIVALARKLAVMMGAMMKTGQVYRPAA